MPHEGNIRPSRRKPLHRAVAAALRPEQAGGQGSLSFAYCLMAEVIHFDPYLPRTAKRRNTTSKTHIPRLTEGKPVFFDRRELNPILSLYGRMVAVNEWRDYAIDSDALAVEFQIYRNSWEFPAYRLIKRGAAVGGRRFALIGGGETLMEDDRLQTILSWLERQPNERVAEFTSHRNRQRLVRPI